MLGLEGIVFGFETNDEHNYVNATFTVKLAGTHNLSHVYQIVSQATDVTGIPIFEGYSRLIDACWINTDYMFTIQLRIHELVWDPQFGVFNSTKYRLLSTALFSSIAESYQYHFGVKSLVGTFGLNSSHGDAVANVSISFDYCTDLEGAWNFLGEKLNGTVGLRMVFNNSAYLIYGPGQVPPFPPGPGPNPPSRAPSPSAKSLPILDVLWVAIGSFVAGILLTSIIAYAVKKAQRSSYNEISTIN